MNPTTPRPLDITDIQSLYEEMKVKREGDIETHACNCIGPQKGAPVCPCMMRSITVENGRYVQKRDLGPAK